MDESRRKGNQGEAFEHYRVLLFSIAYRMTGSASDAEDLVQETYLRYQASESSEIVSLKAYLTTIITRLALNYLKSARVAREQYMGTWLPEPILTSEDVGFPLADLEQQEALSLAFLRLLEALSPPGRAVEVGLPIPPGWAIDAQGRPTEDAEGVYAAGAIPGAVGTFFAQPGEKSTYSR